MMSSPNGRSREAEGAPLSSYVALALAPHERRAFDKVRRGPSEHWKTRVDGAQPHALRLSKPESSRLQQAPGRPESMRARSRNGRSARREAGRSGDQLFNRSFRFEVFCCADRICSGSFWNVLGRGADSRRRRSYDDGGPLGTQGDHKQRTCVSGLIAAALVQSCYL